MQIILLLQARLKEVVADLLLQATPDHMDFLFQHTSSHGSY